MLSCTTKEEEEKTKKCLGEAMDRRRVEQGLNDRLMVELRNEDHRSFQNFMRMPSAMFDEIVERLTPRITKQTTNWRTPLEPGLKVALTLRHLASGAKYKDMQILLPRPLHYRRANADRACVVRKSFLIHACFICDSCVIHARFNRSLRGPYAIHSWFSVFHPWEFQPILGQIWLYVDLRVLCVVYSYFFRGFNVLYS